MKYKRILLKLSGEALQGEDGSGINPKVLESYTKQISDVARTGVETAIVIGGGNIFRGISGTQSGTDRVKGDQMGMLATVINSLALESSFHDIGQEARVFTSIRMEPVGELYKRDLVLREMKKGCVCILAGGTGNPFFTTDTAAALRAVETSCDVLLKGTRVDGVYDSDPELNPAAVRYNSLTFDEAIDKQLKVMDQTAFTMCRENNMPIVVFNMNTTGNLRKVLDGNSGTMVNYQ
jgi:uridylate kinase